MTNATTAPVQSLVDEMVQCACGDEYPANSYGAGFINGSGMCENCDAALPAKDIAQQAAPVAVPDGYRLLPVKITPQMIESALEGHYGKRMMQQCGGSVGVDMTVNDRGYNGTQAMQRMWSGALSAAPTPPAQQPRNRHGVDAHYFHKKLGLVLRDFESFTPDELARTLARLAKVADEAVLLEAEFAAPPAQPPVAWISIEEPFHGTAGIEAGDWDIQCDGKAIDKLAAANSPGRIPLYAAPPAQQSQWVPDECPHVIWFDDADREPLLFAGAGAREAAIKAWEQISGQWNAHLFVRAQSNSRDDRYPCAVPAATNDTAAPEQAEQPASYVDDLIERLGDAQQEINLAANTTMSQALCSASALLDEVEVALRRGTAPPAAEQDAVTVPRKLHRQVCDWLFFHEYPLLQGDKSEGYRLATELRALLEGGGV